MPGVIDFSESLFTTAETFISAYNCSEVVVGTHW